jgi:competence protein ComEA
MPSVSRRPGRQSAEHQAAVARRLEQLRAELTAAPVLHAVPDPPWSSGPVAASEEGWQGDDDDPWWSTATRVRGLAPVPADRASVVAPIAPLGAPLHASPDVGLERWRSPAASVVAPSTSAPGAVLGVPGRHASRRDGASWRALVPETLRGRVSLGPAQLTVVVALLCLGLAALAVTAVRGRPHDLTPVAAPVPVAGSAAGGGDEARVVSLDAAPGGETGLPAAVPAPGDPAAAGATPAAEAGSATSVTVDVAGKVRRPGIAVLEPGARVVDAIEAAGGAREGVSLTSLNLARPLVDGEQVLVGIDPPPGVAAAALASSPAGSVPSAGSGALVDLNAASEAELDTLPDVGPVTAQSILSWREEHGGFTTVDELLEVDGIGEATLAKLAPLVTV